MIKLLIFGVLASAAAFAQELTAHQALERYLSRTPSQCESADRAVEMEIEASVPKLEKQGSMSGLKVISGSGQVAYRALRFTGDKLVKTDVIARFLTAETQARTQTGDISISEQNYKLKFEKAESNAYVFQLRPRKKRTGLFKGELWLDRTTGEPVRESGEFVKSPSIFVRKIRFVREYKGETACAPPARTSITVQTRIAGDAEMVVRQRPVASDWQPPQSATAEN